MRRNVASCPRVAPRDIPSSSAATTAMAEAPEGLPASPPLAAQPSESAASGTSATQACTRPKLARVLGPGARPSIRFCPRRYISMSVILKRKHPRRAFRREVILSCQVVRERDFRLVSELALDLS